MLEIEGHVDIHIIVPLSSVLKEYSLSIKSLDIYEVSNTSKQKIVIKLNTNGKLDLASLLAKIKGIEGVLKVSI